VCAVVVAHRPDLALLRDALAAVSPQVSDVVVVDNSPRATTVVAACVLHQERNIGLAAAQNAGIDWARRHGHTHVLLLDQDSIPAPGMVAALLDALETIPDRIAAVGPRLRDPRQGRDSPFFQIAFPRRRACACRSGVDHIRADFIISSGALVPLAVIDDVGAMDEGLFIDNIDVEWCLRAQSRGYRVYGVCAASMTHHLGDAWVPVLGGRAHVTRRRPVRLYFMMRNHVAMYRRRYAPRTWLFDELLRAVVKFFVFAALVPPRRQHLRFMARGVRDGVRGRTGPCPLPDQGP
jgi:rhamnosyltransferase